MTDIKFIDSGSSKLTTIKHAFVITVDSFYRKWDCHPLCMFSNKTLDPLF